MAEASPAVVLHKIPTEADPDDPPYSIQDIRGKGKGFVATCSLPEGTLIASEQPIFTGNIREWTPANISVPEILGILNLRSEEDQMTFFGLNNAYPDHQIDILYNLIQSNMLIIGGDYTGIFLGLTRINHACNSNAHAEWNCKTEEMTVYAIQDIQPGEEITISYSRSLPMPRQMRRKELKRLWNFECICNLCTLPPHLQQESDERLEFVHTIYSSPMLHLQGPLAKLHDIYRVLTLIKQDGLYSRFANHFYNMASDVAALCSDLARCKYFSHCTAVTKRIIMGSEHPKVVQAEDRAKHPSNHPLFGTWTKWLTRTCDVPRNLSQEEFQDWLWRANVPLASDRTLQAYGDFREDYAFIPFNDLPSVGVLDPDFFYQSSDSIYPLLRRNWCFLGEIVQIHQGCELILEVRDKSHKPDDDHVLVHFIDATKGREYFTDRVPQTGDTIAIMYPVKRHLCGVHGMIGLAVSFPGECTIFPAGLEEIMRVNDQLKQHSDCVLSLSGGAGARKCHKCGKIPASTPCVYCEMFFYCSESCREAARGQTHEDAVCRLLQRRDLKALFQVNWDEYDGLVVFNSPLTLQLSPCES